METSTNARRSPQFAHPLVAALLFCLLAACGSRGTARYPNVVVLGIDGMDPSFVSRHWDELPNLAALRDRGTFQRLATTAPPQSPVAWATFITGLDPSGHELFDFVHRDPQTLRPFSSMSGMETPRRTLSIGPYLLPLTSSRVVSLRRGTPFWQTLADNGTPVEVIHMPTEYPPVDVGHALAGMGTPDLLGSLGTFTFFTDDPTEVSRSVSGGRIVKLTSERGHAILPLVGPPNPLRRDARATVENLIVDVDPEQPAARIRAGSEDVILRQGEWSNWIPVEFELLPHVSSAHGMIRCFARQLHPLLELYVSPINIDPVDPSLPIATPRKWSRTVAREIGRFSTLGIPEDSSALRQDVFTLPEFLAQTKLVLDEERNLLAYALRHYSGGLLFFYFSSIDQNSHILWGKHEAELLQIYRAVDASIGETKRAVPDARLVVLSDHGFAAFDRAVHLNTWLRDRGYLALIGQPASDTDLGSIDWFATKAYALGLNALYVNLEGREAHGQVPPGRPYQALLGTLREQLLAWRDPGNGAQVVKAVFEPRRTPHNSRVAPDLIVGYAPGYRASWQTGIGGTPAEEIEDNQDPWIGDHCINPGDVPGVLFTSWKAQLQSPRLQDVTALVLGLYGFPPPKPSGEAGRRN